MKNLSLTVTEVMREAALDIVEIMILEEQEFRIVIWNNDDWSEPLPERIMESFPTQLVLDIKEQSLIDSYIDEQTGEIVLCTAFDGMEYAKVLELGDIIAVLSLDGQPFILNDFPQDKTLDELDKLDEFQDINDQYMFPKSVQEMVEMISADGIEESAAEHSINMFLRNNPELSEKIKG